MVKKKKFTEKLFWCCFKIKFDKFQFVDKAKKGGQKKDKLLFFKQKTINKIQQLFAVYLTVETDAPFERQMRGKEREGQEGSVGMSDGWRRMRQREKASKRDR